MLGIMRKYKQSAVIKAVFAVIVLSFIGTIFLVWGRGEKGLSGTEFAARVGKTKISLDQYQRYLYQIREMYSQIYGKPITPELEQQMGLKKRALENLIDNALVANAADEMGLEVSKEEVEKEIATIPAFQRDGAFNFQLYQQLLRGQRMTPKAFEGSIREELLVRKVKKKILEKAVVSDDDALGEFRKRNDRIDLLFAAYSPADVRGEAKVTEQEMNAYLRDHQDQFRTPEQRSVSFLMIDPGNVSGKMEVSDEEAENYYRRNIDRFQGKDGFLPFAQVKEQARAAALREMGAKKAYEMAADAINSNSKRGDIAAAAKSLGVAVDETPLFTMTAPAARFAGEEEVVKRAFILKQGELGGPVETSKGIYIIKLKELKPAAVPPLATIKGRVESLAMADKAKVVARKKAEEALAQFAKGAAPTGVRQSGLFGYSLKGEVPGIGTSREIMEAAFQLSSSSPVAKSVYGIGDRFYAIKLKERVEGNRDEFQKKKEEIKKELLPMKQEEVLAVWIKEQKGKVEVETNPALNDNE